MVSPKSRSGDATVPCDFCNDQIAVLYCRADYAKLCLFCDQHVHSANALSRKHLRSQICDNCGSEPVSVRCSTDNLMLCRECDWDAHGSCSVSSAHDRKPVEGFSGCPSALELASAWGLDIDDKKPRLPPPLPVQSSIPNWAYQDSSLVNVESDSWIYKASSSSVLLQDLMVPTENGMISAAASAPKRQQQQHSPSCGKQKQVIMRQLMELFKRNLVGMDGGGGGEDLVSGSPSQSAWQRNVEAGGLGISGDGIVDAVNQPFQQDQQQPFTSLLMMQTHVDPKEISDRIAEEDMVWNTNPSDRGTQIWDFTSGQLRGHEESGPLEVGFSDVGFMMKGYGELLKEASFTTTKGLGEFYGINHSIGHDDIAALNNNLSNPIASQGPATSESNNLPTDRRSTCSGFGKRKCYGGSKDIHFMDENDLVRGETATTSINKVDMDLLAQNRGNAMLRYMEKKKTRRYDKHVRYESRKARADTRKRVKGRFVKASEAPDG